MAYQVTFNHYGTGEYVQRDHKSRAAAVAEFHKLAGAWLQDKDALVLLGRPNAHGSVTVMASKSRFEYDVSLHQAYYRT